MSMIGTLWIEKLHVTLLMNWWIISKDLRILIVKLIKKQLYIKKIVIIVFLNHTTQSSKSSAFNHLTI